MALAGARKRRFAWDDELDGDDGDDGGGDASSSGDEEDEVPDGWESQKTLEIHTQVCPSAEYFELREQSEVEVPSAAPLRGRAVVLRRRQRLRAQPAAEKAPEAARQLRGRGFVVWDDFLGHPEASELLEGFETLQWSPGRLGSAESRSLRGDRIAWPDVDGTGRFGDALRSWIKALDELVLQLQPLLNDATELARVSHREPPMASVYPQHARYIRHYDNNCEEGLGDCNGRRLTAVYYLNKGITDSDGGHLRILGQRGGVYDILPSFDTLSLFWSDRRSPHEVMPNRSQTPRRALSCWYVDLTEASNACAQPMSLQAERQKCGRMNHAAMWDFVALAR